MSDSERNASSGGLARVVRLVGATRWFGRIGPKVVYPVDAWRWRRTGRSPRRRDFPHLVLTTSGRTTGAPHEVPLIYLELDRGFVVVGSNWGRDRHPAWSANLLAHPEATVTIGRTAKPVTAHLATPEELSELWPRLLGLWPAWTEYQTWTSREFRVFVLEPVASPD